MTLSILNNVSDLTAENALSNTQMNLQKTLTQLSTGLKINSGSDDSAGMSIASGMNANIAALTQSQQNASNGVGLLQTADGALAQVTTLLNRAVTLATEGSNSGITNSQSTALNNEFQSIMSEVNQIGSTTNFNGQNVFASNAPSTFTSTQGSVGTPIATTTALTAGSKTTIQDSATGGTFVFTAGASDTVATLQTAITNAVTAGTLSAGTALTINGSGQASISNTALSGINVTSNDANLGAFNAVAGASSTNTVFISDSSTANSAALTQISTTINTLSSTQLGLNASNLNSASSSQTALTAINAAITAISAQRGVIGASVNRLNAASTVMAAQVTNLQSATNSIQNADIGKTVANMTQYNILQSTGMAALQQANQAQQAVLKLVQ
jgi:flagellin